MNPPWEVLLSLLGMVVLVGLSFFFSITETALMACDRAHIRRLAAQGRWQARVVQALLERPERLLSTIQLSDKVVDAAFAALTTFWMVRLFGHRAEIVVYATFLIAAITLLVGEIIPKTLGAYYPNRMALVFSPLLYVLLLALYPAVRLVGGIARWSLRWLHIRPVPERPGLLSDDELRRILLPLLRSAPRLSGTVRLVSRILTLPERSVDAIMIPRRQVEMIVMGTPLDDIIRIIQRTGYSRFPVYQTQPDDLLGILYVKDFWKALFQGHLQRPEDIRGILRPPLVVSSGARVDSVLREMQRRKIHIAAVFDEYGRFEGIVTMEDIIEEIVGEIEDEFDIAREPAIWVRGPQVWEVAGHVSIRELNEALPVPLPESPDYATLAGFLISHRERIPEKGEVIEVSPYRFEVVDREGPRIRRIRVVLQQTSKTTPAEEVS